MDLLGKNAKVRSFIKNLIEDWDFGVPPELMQAEPAAIEMWLAKDDMHGSFLQAVWNACLISVGFGPRFFAFRPTRLTESVSQRSAKILTLFSGGLESTFVLKELSNLSNQGAAEVICLTVDRGDGVDRERVARCDRVAGRHHDRHRGAVGDATARLRSEQAEDKLAYDVRSAQQAFGIKSICINFQRNGQRRTTRTSCFG